MEKHNYGIDLVQGMTNPHDDDSYKFQTGGDINAMMKR